MKKEFVQLFVEDARETLSDLWDQLYYSNEQKFEFAPAHADVFTDASLAAHEHEIVRLTSRVDELSPLLTWIRKHIELESERNELLRAQADPSRLFGRGTNLLQEERTRKKISRNMPRVEAMLRESLQAYVERHGEPFLVWGDMYPRQPTLEEPEHKHVNFTKLSLSTRSRDADPERPRSRPSASVSGISAATPSRLESHTVRSVSTPVTRDRGHELASSRQGNLSRSPSKKASILRKPVVPLSSSTSVLRERTDLLNLKAPLMINKARKAGGLDISSTTVSDGSRHTRPKLCDTNGNRELERTKFHDRLQNSLLSSQTSERTDNMSNFNRILETTQRPVRLSLAQSLGSSIDEWGDEGF